MSAQPRPAPVLARMCERDLADVAQVEAGIYSHPWTRGNFADSLRSGYHCRTWRQEGALVGYFILLVAAGEAHLLNLSIAAAFQRRGLGAQLLEEVMRISRLEGARTLFLEVRPSNLAAQALYRRFGFRQVGTRRGYYPAHAGREDAWILEREL